MRIIPENQDFYEFDYKLIWDSWALPIHVTFRFEGIFTLISVHILFFYCFWYWRQESFYDFSSATRYDKRERTGE